MWRSPTPSNSIGNLQKHGHLLRFQVNCHLGKISGIHVIYRLWNILSTLPGFVQVYLSLQWRHNDGDGVSNHRRIHYLLNRLFRSKSKKTSKLRGTGLCKGNSPVTGEFITQRATSGKCLHLMTSHVTLNWRHMCFTMSQVNLTVVSTGFWGPTKKTA